MKINPQFDQALSKMRQENGLTKFELESLGRSAFNKYCMAIYKDKPRHYRDNNKYRIAFTQEDHAYQCQFLGKIYEGIEKVVTKQAEHIALTTTDPYVLELCTSLGITTNRRHIGIAR